MNYFKIYTYRSESHFFKLVLYLVFKLIYDLIYLGCLRFVTLCTFLELTNVLKCVVIIWWLFSTNFFQVKMVSPCVMVVIILDTQHQIVIYMHNHCFCQGF